MKQFVKFGLVGLSNTILSYLIYMCCLWFFQGRGFFPGTDYLVSSLVAFLISVLWSFYWNDRFTFKKKEGEVRSRGRALLKTYVSYSVTGLFLNNILLFLLVDTMGISKSAAPVMSLVVTIPINYGLNKYWAFRRKSVQRRGRR